MAKITFANKEALQNDPTVAEKNKVTEDDMNEIKEVVNQNYDELSELEEDANGVKSTVQQHTGSIANLQNLIQFAQDDIEQLEYNMSDAYDNIDDLQEDNTLQDQKLENIKTGLIDITTDLAKEISVNDASEVAGILEVQGNHEQDTREGYNVLPNNLSSTTINGVTFAINEDKSINVNGTATNNIIANLITGEYNDNSAEEPLTISEGTTNCRLSGCPTGGSGSTYKMDLWTSNATNKGTDYGEGVNIAVNNENDRKIARVRIVIYSGATLNNLTFKPMLINGTEEKPYEQYGASPSIKHPSEVKCLGSNKNVLNTSLMLETTKGGITSKINSDGSITFNGTCNANNNTFNFYIENTTRFMFDAIKDQTTISAFYISGTITDSNSSGASFRINDKDYNGGYINLVNLPQQKQLTRIYNSASGSVFCDIRFNDGIVLDNFTIKCKAANTPEEAITYSPYNQGGTEITKLNKNWLDCTKISDVASQYGIGIDDDGYVYSSTPNLDSRGWSYQNSNWFITLPAGTYVVSLVYDTTPTNNSTGICISKLDNTRCFAATSLTAFNATENFEFTLEEATEVGILIKMFDVRYKIQLERNTATEYEEHKSESKILPIQQEMLKGDYFVKESDGWKEVHTWNEIVLDGTETIERAGTGASDIYSFIVTVSDIQTGTYDVEQVVENLVSPSLSVASNADRWNRTKDSIMHIRVDNTPQIAIYIEECNQMSVAEFKAYLADLYSAGTPIKIYYKLATPNKLACTDAQKEVLDWLDSFTTYKPNTNIITAEDIGLLRLNYYADPKIYIENLINTKLQN